jgi:hypothetical protein
VLGCVAAARSRRTTVGEGVSSIPLDKVSLPDRGSLSFSRTLFSEVGLRPYLFAKNRICLHAAQTRCSLVRPSLPSSAETNDRTRQLTHLSLADIHTPRESPFSRKRSRHGRSVFDTHTGDASISPGVKAWSATVQKPVDLSMSMLRQCCAETQLVTNTNVNAIST